MIGFVIIYVFLLSKGTMNVTKLQMHFTHHILTYILFKSTKFRATVHIETILFILKKSYCSIQ